MSITNSQLKRKIQVAEEPHEKKRLLIFNMTTDRIHHLRRLQHQRREKESYWLERLAEHRGA